LFRPEHKFRLDVVRSIDFLRFGFRNKRRRKYINFYQNNQSSMT